MSYHSRGPTRPPQVQPFNNPNMHPAVAGARNAPNVQPNIHATPHQHQHTRPTAPSTNPTTDNTSMNTSKEYPTLNPSPGAKWIKRLTQDRLGQFNGGHFGDVNLGAAMYKRVEEGEGYVQMKVWSAPGRSKPSFAEALSHRADFKPAKKGDSFGPSWTNHWWIVHLVLPQEDFEGEERVTCELLYPLYSILLCFTSLNNAVGLTCILVEFDPGCEAMIFDVEGTPFQGITGGYGGDRRVEYIIPPAALAKGSHDILGCLTYYCAFSHSPLIDPFSYLLYLSRSSFLSR
ncbi:hypothetical protein C8F04DRAFT_1271606 [Mycena alexandri]|uniref:Alpha-mannosidase Ams1-like N-terminal domain-containing protein n=1 Tax=Mycena alexandri TaxID=1745969 RepID=A0AAD6WTU2_9AGAR|nr:hypothetical protein C8F04DRAFT_1271606 [Mycena alexandri]